MCHRDDYPPHDPEPDPDDSGGPSDAANPWVGEPADHAREAHEASWTEHKEARR